MKNIIKEYKFIAIFFILVSFILFWQFFLKGLHPYPGNYMLAWFEPWKSDNTTNEAILIPHKPVADDVFRQLYPFKTLAVDILKHFEPPLWNPYNGSGMPLFATMHIGFLNPLNIIFFILSPPLSWSVLVIIQPLLVGIFLYLYCQTIGASKLGSILSGVSFMFSGFVIARSIYNDYNFAVIGTVIALIIIEKYFLGNKKYIFLLPFFIFFIIGSTQPQIIAYSLLFILGYFFYRLIGIVAKNKKMNVLIFLVFFFLGIGFCAIQLVPTFELYQQSNLTIESSRFIFEKFLLPPVHLVSIFIPNYFGNQSTYNYWGAGDYIESIASIGLISTFFAYLAMYKIRFSLKDIRLFFLIVSILSIIASFKSPIAYLLYSLPIPILSTGVPSRVFFLASLSISILAGLGLSNVFRVKYNKKHLAYAISFLTIPLSISTVSILLFAVNLDCNNEIIKDCRTIALRNTFLEVFVFSLAFLIFVFFVRKNRYKEFFSTAIVVLVAIIGLYNAQKFLPFSSRETFNPKNELIEQIRKNSGYSRIFGMGNANIKTNFATFFRFYDPQYYDPLYNKRYGELIAFSNTMNINSALSRSDVEIAGDIKLDDIKNEARNRLLSILGVKYFIYKRSQVKNAKNIVWQDKNWQIVENESVLPRSYTVSNFEVFSSSKDLLSRLFDPSFDPSKTVLLEENLEYSPPRSPAGHLGGGEATSSTPPRWRVESYDPNKVTINTSSNTDALLFLSDTYFPGWKAYIDAKETKIYRANYTFRAVEVPKGQHIVRFSYEPNSFKIGLALSAISIAIYIITVVFIRRLNRKNND